MKLKIKKINELCKASVGSIVETDDLTAKSMIDKGDALEYTDQVAADEKAQAIQKSVKENKVMATAIEKVEEKTDPMLIKSFGEWMVDLTKNPEKIKHTQKASGMSEGTNADGGYLLTAQIANEIFGVTIPGSAIYPKCMKMPIQSNSIKLPIWNNSSLSSTSAPRMYPITPDGGSKTGTKPVLTQKTVSLVTWSYLVYATEELLEDAPAFGNWIVAKIREKAGFDFDYQVLFGTAATAGFEGICTAAANSYRAAATVAATITPASVVNLVKGVLPQYLPGAEWYMSPNAWASAMTLTNTATSVTPYGAMMSADGKSLMGYKVNVMPMMANLNTNGDILFGNFAGYVVAEKNGLNLAISRDFKFDTDEIAYRVTVRQGGAAVIPTQTNVDTSVQGAFSARF